MKFRGDPIVFGDKAPGGGEPPTLLYHAGYLVPIEVHVQSEAHPAPRADVGRDEEPVRLLFHQFGLHPGSRLEPEVGSPVGRTFVEIAEGRAFSHAERRHPVVEAFLHAGEGEADITKPVDQVVDRWPTGWMVHGGADGNRTHDPLLAKQVL